MTTTWEPVTGRVVKLPEWDARDAYLRMQDASPARLALAVKEHLRGASVRCQDAPGEPWYCGDCLADLPAGPAAQDAHECGAEAAAEGDVAWYTGPLPDGYGRLYEVGRVLPGGRLWLHDMGNVLNARPDQVVIVRRAAAAA